jgi:hypothetical protein
MVDISIPVRFYDDVTVDVAIDRMIELATTTGAVIEGSYRGVPLSVTADSVAADLVQRYQDFIASPAESVVTCPFCNTAPTLIQDGDEWTVQCQTVSCVTYDSSVGHGVSVGDGIFEPMASAVSRDMAVRRWNRRELVVVIEEGETAIFRAAGEFLELFFELDVLHNREDEPVQAVYDAAVELQATLDEWDAGV